MVILYKLTEPRHNTMSTKTKPSSSSSAGLGDIGDILSHFWKEYSTTTPQKLKMIDVYLAFILLTGIFQFVYCLIVGTFPFNSFLSGFISCVGAFILAVCLRIQINPRNTAQFKLSEERAFADFMFASFVLYLVVFNFLG